MSVRAPGAEAPAAAEPRPRALPHLPAPLIIVSALLTAVVVGRFFADGRIKISVAIVLAACYAPLVFFDLAVALSVWIALLFFHDLSVFSSGPNAVGLLLTFGWIGAMVGRKGTLSVLRQQRILLVSTALFATWLTLSIAWAGRPGPAGTDAGYWWLAVLAFVIVLTTVSTTREIHLIVLAFVLGSIVSVVIGLGSGRLSGAYLAATGTAVEGRLVGGGGDPNEQAAGFVGAMFLIVGLFSVFRTRTARLWLSLAFVVISVGFFFTQSRGGLIALAVATGVAVIVLRGHRRRIVGLIAAGAASAAAVAVIRPDALQRITAIGGGGSGRDDLWTIAWRVFKDHQLLGIGSGNFQTIEARYTLRPGGISEVTNIVDVPHLVHNTYLQLLTENGVFGLLLYLLVIFGCMRAGLLAIRAFEQKGHTAYADLARAVFMGTAGMLAAIFFISDGNDFRLWILLALGPALLSIASRAPPFTNAASDPIAPRGPVRWR